MPAPRHDARSFGPTTMALTALSAVLLVPVLASASETEGRTRFGLQLREPSVLSLARRATRPKTKAPAPATEAVGLPTAAPAPASAGEGSPDLGFDLLGPDLPAQRAPAPQDGKLRVRRAMLTVHPLMGIGLLAAETATVVVGQLNYNDRFGGGPSSARYQQTHRVLAYTTGGLFVATGLLAILAPNPAGRVHQGLDRVLLHKIGMFTAAAGIVAQIVLGIYTASREGYLNQESLATTHLIVGYSTLAATYVGVGSIVF